MQSARMNIFQWTSGMVVLIFLVKETNQMHGYGQNSKPSILEESFMPHKMPTFDTSFPKNVSALVGKTAFLTCVVRNLRPTQKVSWVRHRDVHILTAGEQTFTSDQRFSAKHNSDDEWVLVIKYVQERDAGKYECQIPTQPPKSYPINLNIIVPHVRIQGSPDLHVNQDSTINLTCVISYSPEPPAYVFWYHNDEVVSYDSPRGGITVVTEEGHETRSHLIIRNARQSDSGKYTCKPSIFSTASVKLYILDDDLSPEHLHTSSAVTTGYDILLSVVIGLAMSRW